MRDPSIRAWILQEICQVDFPLSRTRTKRPRLRRPMLCPSVLDIWLHPPGSLIDAQVEQKSVLDIWLYPPNSLTPWTRRTGSVVEHFERFERIITHQTIFSNMKKHQNYDCILSTSNPGSNHIKSSMALTWCQTLVRML